MAKKAVETYHADGKWHNRFQGSKEPFGSYDTKDPAVANGRMEAVIRQTEHVIKKMDGTIQKRNSYGNDPFPPRG